MNYDYATAMVEQINHIQTGLHYAVRLAQDKADPEDCEAIKKSLGMFIGKLDMELLWPILRAFPDLDCSGIPVPPKT